VDALAEKLDARLREWKPETAAEARERITEVIELADHDVLDIARSRAAEQEVLDLLDEPPARCLRWGSSASIGAVAVLVQTASIQSTGRVPHFQFACDPPGSAL
jgi:hypothetical protein